MVRDFGIMFFQDFLLLVCVYLFLMPLHVMEKKKIKNTKKQDKTNKKQLQRLKLGEV